MSDRRMKYRPGDVPGPTEHGWIPISWWPFESEEETDDSQMFLVLYGAPDCQCVCYIGWWENGEPVWFSGEHRVTPTHWQPVLPFP